MRMFDVGGIARRIPPSTGAFAFLEFKTSLQNHYSLEQDYQSTKGERRIIKSSQRSRDRL